MADERDFELLDDYLTNRMSEQDRSAFEHKLEADPDLQHELAVQKRVIKGIQDARVAELKSMLNNVPVSGHATGNAIGSKILLGAVLSILIAVAGYWYFSRDTEKTAGPENLSEQQVQQEKPVVQQEKPEKITKEESAPVVKSPAVEAQPDKNQTSAGTEHSRPSLAKRPDPLQAPAAKSKEQNQRDPVLDDVNPDPEGNTNTQNDSKPESQPVAGSDNSSLIVETDGENRRYSFHYQFLEGKLYLYGPFEENGYEIVELPAGQLRTAYLYYKDQYYQLTADDDIIRPLTPIDDPVLLKKLRENRSSR